MKNRYAAVLIALALCILALFLLFDVFKENRVEPHGLSPEYTVQMR